MMMCANTLRLLGDTSRKVYLYDTYEGMPEPTSVDIDYAGRSAHDDWQDNRRDGYNEWNFASLEDVQDNMRATEYPFDQLVFVKGLVQNTIPEASPRFIALLRLDTDFHDSTLHELEHLFPLLSPGGVLIIDDYGHYMGQKKAVDDYFCRTNICLPFSRTDHASRIAINTGSYLT